jgi:hypothetical protein
MKQHKITAYYIVALLVLITGACSKIDDYKSNFMAGGSITYSGKMDSVKIFSGRNRVKVTGLFTSDPNIVKYRVFWNSRQDSVEVAVTRTSGVDTAKVIIPNLPEGLMNFEIRTYDAQGHSSIPVDTAANVYGALYQNSLVNRAIVNAAIQKGDGSALITWGDVNKDAGVQKMEIKYADKNNVLHDTVITSVTTGLTTSLPIFKVGNTFSYSTAYLPTPTAIDTFFVAYQTHGVQADVSSIYLANYGPNFQRSPTDGGGRFGTLGAPWIENAAAKNKNGVGGFCSDWWWNNGGQLNWETWGNTPVVDGIIYQPTSSALPAGSYTVSFHYYSEVQSNSSVYCIVSAGGTGIPVLANLSTALGYTALYSGAAVGSTNPHLEETKSFNFTLTTSQVVSIGFLGNVVGNGNPGNYFVVQYINLIQN